jgi:hypothetical protein
MIFTIVYIFTLIWILYRNDKYELYETIQQLSNVKMRSSSKKTIHVRSSSRRLYFEYSFFSTTINFKNDRE